MRLVLHIGTHKTGTTSIQKVLHDHSPYFRNHGLYYPSSSLYRGTKGHLEFSHDVARNTDKSRRRTQAFVRHIKKSVASSETILLSSEALYRHVLGTVNVSSMFRDDYLDGRKFYVSRLAELFEDFDVEVLVYFRNYGYYLSWLYRKCIKSCDWHGTSSDFKSQYFEQFGYGRQLEIFIASFPRLTIYSYESARELGLINHFFDQLSFPVPPGSETVWERPTKCPIHPIA
jgi:hypothetical protein